MQTKVTSAFQARFAHRPAIVVRAPGRVNLLGGHTDYNEGYVLPVAVDRAAWVAAAAIDAREARVRALGALQERGLRPAGMEAVLTSDVPVGAGLSSSAAVEVAFAYAWQQLSGFQLDRRDLALTCQWAENNYVGVNCGIMDQMTSVLGAKGYALLLDCRTLEMEPVPLPEGVTIVVADTGVRRRLAASEYNVRRAQCEQAVRTLREFLPGIHALRDVSLDDLKRVAGASTPVRDRLPARPPRRHWQHTGIAGSEGAAAGRRGHCRRADESLPREPARLLRGEFTGVGPTSRGGLRGGGLLRCAAHRRGVWRLHRRARRCGCRARLHQPTIYVCRSADGVESMPCSAQENARQPQHSTS
jgi:galactokinase